MIPRSSSASFAANSMAGPIKSIKIGRNNALLTILRRRGKTRVTVKRNSIRIQQLPAIHLITHGGQRASQNARKNIARTGSRQTTPDPRAAKARAQRHR